MTFLILINWVSSLPILGPLCGIFHFVLKSSTKIDDADQTPYSVAFDLGLHCLPLSNKKDPRLIRW